MRFVTLTVAAMTVATMAMPAAAKTYSFRAVLGGTKPPTMTGSPASGVAKVRIDTKTKRVSVDLDVTGITLDQLNKGLIAKPIGPVHFHEYRGADDIELVLPLPYGANYTATKNGFHVTVRDYDYEAGVKLVNSGATLDEFVTAGQAGKVMLNIHTEKFPDGEISGALNDS
jgi:hypothetical protein